MRTIQAVPLDAKVFSAFGSVVSAGVKLGSEANQGTAQRFDFCADLISTRDSAKANLAVFRSTSRTLPLDIVLLERHPCSTQVFIPMVISRYLVCVAPTRADGMPELDGLRAFICGPGQGVSYAPGTWHHPMVSLDTPGDFAMLAWEDGGARDCEIQKLEQPITVTL